MQVKKTFQEWVRVYENSAENSVDQVDALEGMQRTGRYWDDWIICVEISQNSRLDVEHPFFSTALMGLMCTRSPAPHQPSIIALVWNWFWRSAARI
jgi:hypothetical protein